MITYLQNLTDRDTALIYVSDHGESLGENGIYLHGLPYAIAPDVQREVPMLMWLSKGLLDVTTTVREPSLDLFAGCRRPATAAQAATQIRATAPQSR